MTLEIRKFGAQQPHTLYHITSNAILFVAGRTCALPTSKNRYVVYEMLLETHLRDHRSTSIAMCYLLRELAV